MTRDITHLARMCMLTAGILMAVQALVSAQPTRILVRGFSDLQNVPVGGEIVEDPAGNLHIKQFAQTGDFKLVELDGGDFAIQGTQVLVLNGVLDETESGPIAGRFTVTAEVDDVETVIWKGTIHGTLEGLHFIGHITAHGRGPYAGLILTLDVEEIAPTETTEKFELTGSILDPHGSQLAH
jgi:hypothetical protein